MVLRFYPRLAVYVVGDADPNGVEIAARYVRGSDRAGHLREELTIPTIRYIGYHIRDAVKDGVAVPYDEKNVHHCNMKSKLDTLLKAKWVKEPRFKPFLDELQQQKSLGKWAYVDKCPNIVDYVHKKIDGWKDPA